MTLRAAIDRFGRNCCSFCGEPIYFPQFEGKSGMSPPIIFFGQDGYFICEKCFKAESAEEE